MSTIGSIILIGSLITMILIDRIKTNAIFHHGKFTYGRVLKFYKDYRGNGSVKFTYEVNGKSFERESGLYTGREGISGEI